jgi:hypothetical protein
VPLERHDLVGVGFEKARRRQTKRQAAAILDLEREVPKLRALATRRWQDATAALDAAPGSRAAKRAERDCFWDWALLELLLQSGLRIEEACELTTLDILKRRHGDGRTYYLLHVKPSKFDRARVIPIGDGLGRVIGQIVRHVKAFYSTSEVPACDGWDSREKAAGPHAPYLLQGAGHPSQIAYAKPQPPGAAVPRGRSAPLGRQRAAVAPARLPARVRLRAPQQQHADPRHPGAARPRHARHRDDLRQALPDDADRRVPQGRPRDLPRLPRPRQRPRPRRSRVAALQREPRAARHGHPPQRAPGRRALPPRPGLPRLQLRATQESAAAIFQRMLTSHQAALDRARGGGEPAGQLAARELEVQRISSALRRADALDDDVGAAIEAA